MNGVMDVLATVVRTRVSGDESFVVINAEPFGIDFEGEFLGGVEVRNGIAIGLEEDAAAAAGRDRLERGRVVSQSRQRSQAGFFLLEHFAGFAMGFTMNADVGDGAQPLPAVGIERFKRSDGPAPE